jgi:hypothetical protein
MSEASIIREEMDGIAKTRISLGQPVGTDDFYLVFRGEPEDIVKLLKVAHDVAKHALPQGIYQDKRGRPQG